MKSLRITMPTVSTRDTRILNYLISNANLLNMEYLMKIYNALIAIENFKRDVDWYRIFKLMKER
jgi:hypothetical protein